MDPDAGAAARRQRLWLLGASAVVVAALVVIGIAIGGAGGDESGTTTGRPQGAAATRALFAGIPQDGIQLGDPKAPVTVTEFADLQCPFCGESARNELPEVVRRYVRTGRVKLELRLLTFIGEDSKRGAAMAAAAAEQDRMWQFVDLVYRNQGAENTGWVTDAYVRRIMQAAGLDVRRAFADHSAAARAQIAQAKSAARTAGVGSTPTFLIAPPGKLVKGDGNLLAALAEALKRK
jgi:protein-disulfide isomerase